MINRNLAALITLVAIIAAIYLFSSSSTPRKMENAIKLPETQITYCSIIENAKNEYRLLLNQSAKAREQQNGIVQEQLDKKMNSVYKNRNEAVFQFLQQSDFKFNGWIFLVEKISAPQNNKIQMDLHPLCSSATTLHVNLLSMPEYVQFLSGLRKGDNIAVSGAFVEKWGGPSKAASPSKPISPDEFEGSFTKVGSVTEPEYAAIITSLN